MLGWLSTKGENARVRMCVKEVSWDLEARTSVNTAKILLTAQLMRLTFLDDGTFPSDFFDRPLDYSRKETFQIYEMLEAVRNNNVLQRNSLQKSMTSMGMPIPEFMLKHFMDVHRGIEIWMCTVGTAVVPEVRDTVRSIWQRLQQSSQSVDQALHEFTQVEMRVEQLTGSRPGMAEACREIVDNKLYEYVPSSLRKSIL